MNAVRKHLSTWTLVELICLSVVFNVGFFIGGCSSKQPAHSPLVLSPGQTAVLLEDVQAIARIPYSGDALYEGPAVFQKGSMVVKPRVEGEK